MSWEAEDVYSLKDMKKYGDIADKVIIETDPFMFPDKIRIWFLGCKVGYWGRGERKNDIYVQLNTEDVIGSPLHEAFGNNYRSREVEIKKAVQEKIKGVLEETRALLRDEDIPVWRRSNVRAPSAPPSQMPKTRRKRK